jgi:hypothetical protein
LIPRRGAGGLDQALVEHHRLQPMASAKGIDLGERGLGIEALRPNNISN